MDVGTDGLSSSQVDPTMLDAEVDNTVEPTPADSRYDDLNAKMDMLSDTIVELRGAIVQRQPAAEIEEEFDDDEPLTSSKVNKIVTKAIKGATAVSNNQSQRQLWDGKAKEEFPITDPKFQLELKKVWNEFQDSGLDPSHPKALYQIAKTTAQRLGTKKAPARATANTEHTSEAPSSSQTQVTARSGRKPGMVPEDDPRVRFYTMKGVKDPKKVEAMRARLFEKDSRKANR